MDRELSDPNWGGPRTSLSELAQARLIKIAHRRLATRLNPFGMLPSKVVVNLLPKLGHGLDRVANDRWFEHNLPRGRHNLLDKRRGGYVHSNSLRKKGNNRGPGFCAFCRTASDPHTTLSPPKLQMTLKARTLI